MNGPVACAKQRLGRVEERQGRPGRWRIDYGKQWPGRFIFTFKGVPLDSKELADAVATFVEAQVMRGRALEDVLAEVSPDGAGASVIEPLLQRWIEGFKKKVATEKRQPRTLAEYERWVGDHFSWWHGKTLADVDSQAIEDWDHALATERKLKPKTRRNVLSGFRSFLRWVHEQRPTFVIPRFEWPEVDEHMPTIITEQLQSQLIATIPWPKQGVFWLMALTLVRPSEARVLRLRDWDGADQIRVGRAAKDNKKGGVVRGLKSRNVKVVPVEFPLNDWLAEHVPPERRLAEPDSPLFRNPDSPDGWWSKSALRRAWQAACEKVGVEGVSLYEGLKHSSATHLKALGADDRVLAQLAGHRDPRSILRYAKLEPGTVATALRRLRERK